MLVTTIYKRPDAECRRRRKLELRAELRKLNKFEAELIKMVKESIRDARYSLKENSKKYIPSPAFEPELTQMVKESIACLFPENAHLHRV